MNRNYIFIIIALIIVGLGTVVALGVFQSPEENLENMDGGGVACTADAMMCPDGSYIGRTGPECEFVCPTGEIQGVGVLSGEITLSPVCPVERIPPDPACAPKAYVTDVAAIKKGTNQIIAETKTTSNGRYFLDLPVGTYIIHVESGAVFPRCEEKEITINDGERLTLDISCDTGIR